MLQNQYVDVQVPSDRSESRCAFVAITIVT